MSEQTTVEENVVAAPAQQSLSQCILSQEEQVSRFAMPEYQLAE